MPVTHESFCSPRPSASASPYTVYSEHRVVPSRPALSRRSCLEPFNGHPGRYCRIPSRSTDFKHCSNRQADNGYGLDAQRDQITRYCADNGLDLVALIPDVMSGKRTDKLYGRIAAITVGLRWFWSYVLKGFVACADYLLESAGVFAPDRDVELACVPVFGKPVLQLSPRVPLQACLTTDLRRLSPVAMSLRTIPTPVIEPSGSGCGILRILDKCVVFLAG